MPKLSLMGLVRALERPTPGSRAGRSDVRPARALTALAGFLAMSAVAGLLVAAAATPAVAMTGWTVGGAVGVFDALPDYLKIDPLASRSTMYATRDGKPVAIATFYSQDRIIDSWDQVGQLAKDAAVATEDPRFYEHGAVDPQGTVRALASTAFGNTQGGSSITQQYVKNVRVQSCEKYNVDVGPTGTREQQKAAQEAMNEKYRDCYNEFTDQSATRKIQEMKLAIGVEKKYTKQQILLGYLNIAPFGGRVFGIESAARYYFSTTAAKLTLEQAATLIGMVNNPSNLRIDQPASETNGAAGGYKRTLDRRDYVLHAMLDAKKIDRQQYDAAITTKVQPAISPQASGCAQAAGQNAAFFCEAVMREMQSNPAFGATQAQRDAVLSHGGLSVYTTLNLNLQAEAQRALGAYIPASSPRLDVGAADVSVELNTGRVVLAVQNRPYNQAATPKPDTTNVAYAFDYAHGGSMGFQTGSTFKAFSLIEWLKSGHSLGDVIIAPSAKTTIPQSRFHSSCDSFAGTWTLKNDSAGEGGAMTVLTATKLSVNTAFALMGQQFDLCQLRDDAAALGVKPAYPYQQHYTSTGQLENMKDASGHPVPAQLGDNPASILGTNNVSPLDMAVAYAGIANGGKTCSPVYIDKVVNDSGTALPVPKTTCQQAIDPKLAAGVTYALAHGPMLAGGTAATANPHDGIPLMGKTGTTDNAVQNWLVTSTTKVANAVWVGNVQGQVGYQRLAFNGVAGRDVKFPVARPILAALNHVYGGGQFPQPDARAVTGAPLTLPDLAGKSPDDARALLNGLGFVTEDAGPQDSARPAGTVSGTDPTAGTMLSKGSLVRVYVSNASQVLVPDVRGTGGVEAAGVLRGAGLEPRYQDSSRFWATVVSQDPAPNTPVRRGSAVTLVAGPADGAG